jgi:hypothetical protein
LKLRDELLSVNSCRVCDETSILRMNICRDVIPISEWSDRKCVVEMPMCEKCCYWFELMFFNDHLDIA